MSEERKARYRAAVGLAYSGGVEDTPEIAVKGERLTADEIVKIARQYGIPVVERGPLASALLPLELSQEVPASLFEAVATVLVEIDRAHDEASSR